VAGVPVPVAKLPLAARKVPVTCPGCARVIDLPAAEVGTMIECARCDKRFVAEPDALPLGLQKRRHRKPAGVVGFVCPYCGTDAPPTVRSDVSQTGWIVFFVLLFSCFGLLLCWLGLLIREVRRECSQCGIRLGG
jgi:hypothetical protein